MMCIKSDITEEAKRKVVLAFNELCDNSTQRRACVDNGFGLSKGDEALKSFSLDL